jgi:hypothetical protein
MVITLLGTVTLVSVFALLNELFFMVITVFGTAYEVTGESSGYWINSVCVLLNKTPSRDEKLALPLGTEIDVKPERLKSAFSPIDVTPVPKVMLVRELASVNAKLPIVVTESGIVKVVRAEADGNSIKVVWFLLYKTPELEE